MVNEPRPAPAWPLVAGVTVLLVMAAGWFLLSWQVMHTPPPEAIGEALGVTFALLIVVSVIGAIRGRRRGPG